MLQAGALGEGGEIFFLEMGTPVRIAEMARDLIKLSGKRPDIDIEIVYTGLREGEKLCEELITAGEDILGTRHEKIMLARPNGHWYGHQSQDNFRQWFYSQLEDLYRIALTHDALAIKQKLKEIIPEYTPQRSHSVLETVMGENAKHLNEGVSSGGNE